jgi:ubiquinol-cytochrome c reductase cytochrome b subunit
MPFLIVVVVILHLVLLHQDGSNNPLGISSNTNKIDFYPYFYVKDLFSLLVVLTFFSIVLFYFPNAMGHPDNYIPADSLVTPPHIVPEWYFLPFYAILRAIPDKLGGVFAMGLAIVVLFFVPYLNFSKIYSSRFRPLYRIGFWFFFVNSMILGWIGQKIVEYPYAEIAQLSTLSYFGYFLLILPILSKIENSVNIKNLKNK